MRFLFLTIKFMPYWMIPLGLIFAEMAMIFRRRGNKKLMTRMIVLSGFFFFFTILFFVLRWDTTLFPWIKEALALQ